MSGRLIIRADAGRHIGAGHVMRCLALAERWQHSGGDVTFLTKALSAPMQARLKALAVDWVEIRSQPGSLQDAAELCQLASEQRVSWIVLDGYHFDEAYQRQVKQANLRLLCLDDYGQAKHCWADLVLNQNLNAQPALYSSKEPYTRLLLGHRFVLLRREFLQWRDWSRVIPERARKVLITFGGGDPVNVTLKAVQSLSRVGSASLRTTVLAGAQHPALPQLNAALERMPSARLICDATNMAELMAEADVAIAAGGTTAWELAFMGLPSLLVALAENQIPNTECLARRGAARDLGWHEKVTPDVIAQQLETLSRETATRAELSRCGRALIDGRGTARVWLHLNAHRLRLRAVIAEDCRLKWEWANDPTVRAMSFSSEPISWERHVAWFQTRLRDPHCHFWLATDEAQEPIGQVRFESKEDPRSALMSITLDAQHRGKNLGALLIWIASRKLFAETSIQRIEALVKMENTASQRAFVKAGFQKAGERTIRNQRAFVYELRKTDAF
jgi:UDP-2,4-diacetamido-2,4,6-trideoxy-beta-L-altropyranose hydrolase